MNEIYSELLGDIAIFGGINQETINIILNDALLIQKEPNQYFFIENDIAENMYILVSGEVEVIKNRNNTQYPVTKLHKGDCFGEMAILDHYPRSASVKCVNKCTALQIDINCFDEIYQRDVKQFALLQMNLGREVCRRLREANELLFQNEIENQVSQIISL